MVDKRVALRLESRLLAEHGFQNGFSLRAGGVSTGPYASLNLGRNVGDDASAVAENHRRMAAEVGYAPDALCEVDQVHGGDVQVVRTREDRGCAADAMVSTSHPLGIRVADCAAVLIADPAHGAVAAAHAGWRGVVASVVPRCVRALCALHDSASPQLLAAVFPCIGLDAFEVGEDVALQIANAAGAAAIRVGAGKPHVDLQRAVHQQLLAAGVTRVELVSGCTYSEPARFFSYRRDGGVTGRHLAVIMPRC
ncbi:MAG TPA: peptidoglycan editing factor PgeF [Polyangiales bacterium]